MKIKRLPEFDNDIKILKKKYRSLEDDLTTFIKVQIKLTHELGIDNSAVLQIANLGIDYPKIYKARKFACKSLKGKGSQTGIRIIYAYYEKEQTLEFIEIYIKSKTDLENRKRIFSHYK